MRLFSNGSIHDELDGRRRRALAEVEQADADFVTAVDPQAWADALIRHYSTDAPEPDIRELRMSTPKDVELQRNPPGVVGGFTTYGGERYRARGEEVELYIGVSGEAGLMSLRLSNVHGLPHVDGRVTSSGLGFTVTYPLEKRPDLRQEALSYVRGLHNHLRHVRDFVERHNTRLAEEIPSAIIERRERERQRREWIGAQGIPLVDDTPQTPSRTITIERRVAPARAAGATTAEAELALADEDYEFIVDIVRSKVRSMERMSANYASWDEEALRDDLVAVLNTHYPGDVTGETFNKSGKTDILVRADDRNVFIGECKWWSGAKGLREDDLPQLLSYRTWRDTKLALIYFSDRKDIHRVRDTVHGTLPTVEGFAGWTDEAEFALRCELHPPGQPQRRMDLAVEFVDLGR